VVLALAAVPFDENPLRRLAGGDGDGRDPTFDVVLDPAPLRPLCSIATPTYYVDARGQSPLAQGNAKAAGQLYVACGFPVQDPARADTVVQFRSGRFQVLHRID
jgi:hypothetical protein